MLPCKKAGGGEVFVVEGGRPIHSPEALIKKHKITGLPPIASATTATTTISTGNANGNSTDKSTPSDSNTNGSNGADSLIMGLGNGNPSDIYEDFHSRQLAVYGRETMRRLFAYNILISGMQGLGVEIAKNLILAGIKSVTLHDEGVVEFWDLSSNFIFSEDDVGKNRALASVQMMLRRATLAGSFSCGIGTLGRLNPQLLLLSLL